MDKKIIKRILFLVVSLSFIIIMVTKEAIPKYNNTYVPDNTFVPIKSTSDTLPTESLETLVTLYRTKTGKCYHFENCAYLYSKIIVTPDIIKTVNLHPCSFCNPPDII